MSDREGLEKLAKELRAWTGGLCLTPTMQECHDEAKRCLALLAAGTEGPGETAHAVICPLCNHHFYLGCENFAKCEQLGRDKAEAVGAAGTFNAIYEIATRALAESHTEDTRALVEICNICEGLSDGPAPADALREARGYFWADPRLKGITLASDQFALVIQSIAAWEKMYAVKHTADRQQMAVDIMHSGLLQRMLLGDGEVYESAALRESAKEET